MLSADKLQSQRERKRKGFSQLLCCMCRACPNTRIHVQDQHQIRSKLELTLNQYFVCAELDDNRMHPARSAPRCLPCNYTDPLQEKPTNNEFEAPMVRAACKSLA